MPKYPVKLTIFSVLFLSAFLLSALFFSSAPARAVVCEIDSKSTAVPSGFGAAYNPLTVSKETLVKADCAADTVTIEAGSGALSQYIYENGYIYRGGSWQPINFKPVASGTPPWYPGQARATISLTADERDNVLNVLAYVCQWTGWQWKCGCRDLACKSPYWQLQRIKWIDGGCLDQDKDGYGAASSTSCALSGVDCHDTEYFANPGANETCDGIDNNCDGRTDEGCDDDKDKYCDKTMTLYRSNKACPLTAYIKEGQAGNDCDDTSSSTHPGMADICGNGLDDNCDGKTDETCDTTPPGVVSFSITPATTTSGITAAFTVKDENNLKQVELWRSPYQPGGCDEIATTSCAWAQVKAKTLAERLLSTGVLVDTPPADGRYFYGLHVVDEAGNWTDEGSWGPIKIAKVTACKETCAAAPGCTSTAPLHGDITTGVCCESGEYCYACDTGYAWQENICTSTADTAKPRVEKFSVTPTALNAGSPVTAGYTARDETGLQRVELWRTPYATGTCDNISVAGCSWTVVNEKAVAGGATTNISTLTDTPPAGTYFYGLHAVDTSNNWGAEDMPAKVTANAVCAKTCASSLGCLTAAPANAATTAGTCCGAGEACYDCQDGYTLVGASCLPGCSATCVAVPGCRTASLPNTHGVTGTCCGAGEACLACNTGYTASGTICIATPDNIKPVVSPDFDVNPKNIKQGSFVTATFNVTDETGLQRVELWRATFSPGVCDETAKSGCTWSQIGQRAYSGTDVTHYLHDTPAAGVYFYGLHAVDTSGNVGTEETPIQVTVNISTDSMPPVVSNFSLSLVPISELKTSLGSVYLAGSAYDLPTGNVITKAELSRAPKVTGQCENASSTRCLWSVVHTDTRPCTECGYIYFDSPNNGTYLYSLTVYDGNGNTAREPNPPGPLTIAVNLDRIPPVIYSFSVASGTLKSGESITANYVIGDDRNLALASLERTKDDGTGYPDDSDWFQVNSKNVSGTYVPEGQMINTPPDGEISWYRLKVTDEYGNEAISAQKYKVTKSPDDVVKPRVASFSVFPTALTAGNSVTASYAVTDNTGLLRAELWRATYSTSTCHDTATSSCVWAQVSEKAVSGTSTAGTLTNTPTAAGAYYYGFHAVDKAENWGTESMPIKVTVTAAICAADGCNDVCPVGCSAAQDGDCGCVGGNACCGKNCLNSSDNDCPLDDTVWPQVTAFSLTPPSGLAVNTIDINYNVVDNKDLKAVRLKRTPDAGDAPDEGAWAQVGEHVLKGIFASGSFTDRPPATGLYWYGLNVIDATGKMSKESIPLKATITACVPDGCNGICPTVCTDGLDPDCACTSGNFCCGRGCDYTADTDCPEDILPVIVAFDVQPRTATSSVSVTWSVEDNLALDRVELWRALYVAADCNDTIRTGCNWGSAPVSEKTVAGTVSTGNFSDIPAPGTYWYGLHAVDAVGNIAVENQPIKAILITMPLIKINMFTAAVNPGDSGLIDIAWSVEDPADYLERIEIWSTTDYRGAPNSSGWQKITSLTVDLSASSLKSHNGSATHAPVPAVYWYGLHAINKKGTRVTEGNIALFTTVGNGLSRMGPDRVVMPLPGDVLPPVVDAYDINPKTVAPGENYTLTWSASDDAGLAWIELSSSPDMGGAPDPTQWTKKGTLGTSGTIATGTVTLTATTTASVWWLALKAIDTTGKIGSEPDPPGPIMVTAGP